MKRLLLAVAAIVVGFSCLAATLPLGPGSIFPIGPSNKAGILFAGPCDLAATAGTPCVAAHSVTRRMLNSYAGSLFQITRASDSTTQNIGALANGRVNQAAIDTFCAATTCTFSLIYDQMHTPGSGNNLPQATAINQAPVTYTTFSGGQTLPMVATVPTQFYRNRAATVSIPTGNSSITEYMVVNTFQWSPCCGTYGDMEATVANSGSGHMFALAFGTGAPQQGSGAGPWPGVDWENGVYEYGATPAATLLTNLSKYNAGLNSFVVKSDAGLTGTLSLLHSAAPPVTAAFEGGLSLGEGGDGTTAPSAFFEGIIIAGATTDALDNAIAANAAAFYGGTPSQPQQINPLYQGAHSASATSVTINPLSNVPGGSFFAVLAYDESGSTPQNDTVTDTQGNVYTLDIFQCQGFTNGTSACNGSSGEGYILLFHSYNIHALTTSDVVTFTVQTPGGFVAVQAMSATGILASSEPLDATAKQSAFGTSGQPVVSSTPSFPSEFFIATAGADTAPSTKSPGWIFPFDFAHHNDGAGLAGTLRNPGLSTLSYKPTGAVGNWGAIIAGFKTQ